jgi:Tol biopolymer transport system component
MRLIRNLCLLFLISFGLYGCIPSEKTLPQSVASPIVATPPLAPPSPEQQKKEILLVDNTSQQRYYVSDFSGAEMTPLELPAELEAVSMSPDGRMVAYIPANYGGDPAAIYLLDINSKKTTKLTNSDDIILGIGSLSWSPDSQEIAFSCWVKKGIEGLSLCSASATNLEMIKVLVKAETLNVSQRSDGAMSPAWNSDGSKIVFQSSRTPAVLAEGVKTQVPVDLWMFDVASQQAKRIFISDTSGISMIGRGIFLPGENAILFSGRKDTYATIFKYDLDTQKIQDITASGNRYDIGDIVLSPDGKTFLADIPLPADSSQYVPTLFSIDGGLIRQLDSLKNMQVVSWGE